MTHPCEQVLLKKTDQLGFSVPPHVLIFSLIGRAVTAVTLCLGGARKQSQAHRHRLKEVRLRLLDPVGCGPGKPEPCGITPNETKEITSDVEILT